MFLWKTVVDILIIIITCWPSSEFSDVEMIKPPFTIIQKKKKLFASSFTYPLSLPQTCTVPMNSINFPVI